jgi:hypothetical protein
LGFDILKIDPKFRGNMRRKLKSKIKITSPQRNIGKTENEKTLQFGGILKNQECTKVGVHWCSSGLKFIKLKKKSKRTGGKTDESKKTEARGKIRDRVSSSWAKTTRYCSTYH